MSYDQQRLDQATSRRLARLGTLPIDTSRLEAAMSRELGPRSHGRVYAIFHSVRTVAASVAVLAILGMVLLYMTTAPVSASPAMMIRLHDDLVSGRSPVTRVESIEEANRELASQWPESPGLPGVPREHVMACCMKSVANKHVACVLLKGETAPVSMMVASAADVRTPRDGSTERRGDRTYYVHSAPGSVNMVSTVQDGRYVCLIGSLPADRLIDLAAQLRF